MIVAVLVVAALAAGAARGVTPGTNGSIYFENFSEDSGSSEIFVIDCERQQPPGAHEYRRTRRDGPAVSPNGNQIAILSNVGDRRLPPRSHEQGRQRHARAGRRRIENTAPTWSPNSTQIAFGRCVAVDATTPASARARRSR